MEGRKQMDNQKILDNVPEGATHIDRFGDYQKLNKDGESYQWTEMIGGNFNWYSEKPIVSGLRSLADIKRIVELEQDRGKYEGLYNLAIAMDYPKKQLPKQTKMLMGNAANKTIRQQFEEHRPFIEDCARDGMTMAQIAKRLDVTPIRLANAFKSLDISINRLRSEGARQ